MLYKEPFILYLNISVCIILLFLALPTLLNRREKLKVRLSFFLIFFVVIMTCLVNLIVLHWENYRLYPIGNIARFLPLLFGPLIYYYVKNLLGGHITKGFFISFLPGIVSVAYGIYLALANPAEQQRSFQQMLDGRDFIYEISNLLTLVLTLVYCIKAWFFINKFQQNINDNKYLTSKIKVTWAREFIVYMFANVLIFLIFMLVLTKGFGVSSMDTDLIGMPIFMLFVYLLVAVRSMMMYKEFEFQFLLANIAHNQQIQDQRLEISRELHDSMGAQLTFMSSILDGLKSSPTKFDQVVSDKIHRLSEFSENSISELKNTLWVLNTKEINLNDLKVKILNFIKSASEAKEDLKFDFNFEISKNCHLHSKYAVNIFRVIQEIINNAIKYAQASEIKIEVHQNDSNLKIKIADNGIGFDYEKEKNKSFGLTNIKNRITEINGTINLETAIEKGTHYSIQIDL